MDKRHPPSSFQQLEKLGEGTYATVSPYLVPYLSLLCKMRLLTWVSFNTGLQGSQQTDGCPRCAQGDSS